jgi:FK506-binding protein 8
VTLLIPCAASAVDLIVTMMHIGETALVKADARFAYGERGLEPLVPPSSPLFFHIALISASPALPLSQTAPLERLTRAQEQRSRGVWYFGRGEFPAAARCFQSALRTLGVDLKKSASSTTSNGAAEDEEGEPDGASSSSLSDQSMGDNADVVAARQACLVNLTVTQWRLGFTEDAGRTALAGLRMFPRNDKLLFHMGRVLLARGEPEEALRSLDAAIKINPTSHEISELQRKAQLALNAQAESQRKLYQRMFSAPSSSPPSPPPSPTAPAPTSTRTLTGGWKARLGDAAAVFVALGAVLVGLLIMRLHEAVS